MRKIAIVMIMTILTTSSLASTIKNTNSGQYILANGPAPTAIKKDQNLVRGPRVAKPKLFRSNPLRKSQLLTGSDPVIDDEDVYIGYRRRDLQKIQTDPAPDNPEGLNDHVRWQLFLARTAALVLAKNSVA
jgi:hypothetical protein